MDNVSFHPETNFKKWKYTLQRRFKAERDLGKETMNIGSDDGPSYDKLVKKLRKVFDVGKFVKLSSSTLN